MHMPSALFTVITMMLNSNYS